MMNDSLRKRINRASLSKARAAASKLRNNRYIPGSVNGLIARKDSMLGTVQIKAWPPTSILSNEFVWEDYDKKFWDRFVSDEEINKSCQAFQEKNKNSA